MKLVKRLKHTIEKNRIISELHILIYRTRIIWYLTETGEFKDGDEFTEDQPIDDYIKNGPPLFASHITDDLKNEISMSLSKLK